MTAYHLVQYISYMEIKDDISTNHIVHSKLDIKFHSSNHNNKTITTTPGL